MATRAVRVVPTDDSADNGALDSIMEAANSGGGGGEAIGLPDKLTMQGDVERLNNRLRRMNAGLLNPRGKIMQYWDFFTLSALFYTATVTPYEVCMMWGEPKFYNPTSTWLTPLFIVNWFVNVVFMVDICFNFFLPYREPIAKGGGMVKNHRLIAKNYLCSWFPLDIISVVPVDNIMMAIDTTQIKGASMLAAIRLLRLLRLIKLARILRASRIFSRWENSISLSYAKQDLIRWTIIIMILLHWLACILGILAQLMAPPRTDALAEAVQTAIAAGDPQCYGCMPDGDLSPGNLCASPCLTPCEVAQLARLRQPNAYDNEIATEESRIYLGQSWVCRYANDGAIAPPVWHAEVWIAAMYVALIQLGGGVGSIVPMNWLEYIVFSFGIILGSVTWAMVVGTICATMATGDPKANEFKAGMDALNYFLEDMQMPAALRVRAREYFRNKRDLLKTASYNDLLHEFSPDLQADIVLHMSAKTLDIVWYLSSLEQGARVELAMRLERAGYAPREKISSVKLTILMRGVAAKAGNILTPPAHWGDDMVVSSVSLRDMRHASALTYVEVATLSRDDLDDVLANFPASAAIIRQAAMRVAMKRAVVIISEFVRSRRELQANSDPRLKQQRQLQNAFGGGDSSDDPAMILRVLTGGNLKDIVDGQLVEEVGGVAPTATMATLAKDIREIKEQLAKLVK